jgi:hypothetical protein
MLEGAFIDVSGTDILDRYGSVAAYLRDGLGLGEDEIRALADVLALPPGEGEEGGPA